MANTLVVMADGPTLAEQLEKLGDWDDYKTNYFLKLDPKQRANELTIFQQAMNEQARPTREFASYFAKKRELDDLDRLLRSSGR
jgi:hypothetical protein